MPPRSGDLRVWRRHHHNGIVAEVRPVPGMGTWDICVLRDGGSEEPCQGSRYAFLTEAHNAADALAWATFAHQCDDRCGRWTAVVQTNPAGNNITGRRGRRS